MADNIFWATVVAYLPSPSSGNSTTNSSPPRRADRVAVAYATPEPAGDFLQQLIAGLVPERVVDLLESVEIENGVNPRLQTMAIAAIVTAAYASGVCAEEADMPDFSFNGFGTLGVVHSSDKQADFTSSYFKPDDAGLSDDFSASVDSLVGAQLSADLTPQLVAVVQIIAEENYDDTIRPHIEWANINYEFMPDLSVRVGRTVLPVGLLSDTRKVGYTYAWVRPPRETYRLFPIINSDGVDVSYRLRSGELTNTVQIGFGSNEAKLPNDGGTFESEDMLAISDTTHFGAFTGQVGYFRVHGTLAALNHAFLDVFRQFGPQGVAITDKYSLDRTPICMISLGANYDPGPWFVTGEWGRIESNSFINGTAWYAGGGYGFGRHMPYLEGHLAEHRFPNGSPAVPIDQAEASAAREAFYTQVTGKSAAQIKAHWSKIIFTGRGKPPKAVSNGIEARTLIAANPRAIGDIDRDSVDGSVKVLLQQ